MNKILLDRRYWLLPLALWTAVVAASLGWNLSLVERQLVELSTGQAREVFHLMESMRLWNARQGGVYVVQNAGTPPNPYLEGGKREVETRDGRRLSLVNPAYMTRLVADTLYELTRMRVHITSLDPINPGNVADPWEAEALRAFERGEAERAAILGDRRSGTARYMAPLVTHDACLECHAHQGYKVGDIRGGISISFPTEPIVTAQRKQAYNVVMVHFVGWLLVALLTLLALSRSRELILTLDGAKREQEALVQQRTAELRREVTERRQAEKRLRLLVEASGSGIFGLAPDGACTFINPEALRLLGAGSAETFLGRPILDLILAAGPCRDQLRSALAGGASLHSDKLVFQRCDGSVFNAELQLDPIGDGDADGAGGAVVIFADITRRKAEEASVWQQANFDVLTGLANRHLFYDRLEQMVAEARRSPELLALLFIDLDGFKTVNDTHGHAAGDHLLQSVARRIAGCIRESDVAARLGGDEFVVVLRHLTGESHAGAVAAKLLAAISAPCDWQGAELKVAASIGIALYPHDAATADDLVRHADRAMYDAKDKGKATYRYYAEGRFGETWMPVA